MSEEELPTAFSPKCGGDSDTLSLGVHSFSPDLDRPKPQDFRQPFAHSLSSPDLRLLSPVPLPKEDPSAISRSLQISSSDLPFHEHLPSLPPGNASSREVVILDRSPGYSIQKPNSPDIIVGTSDAPSTIDRLLESLPQNPSPVAFDVNDSLLQPIAPDHLEFGDDESDISHEEVMLERALMVFSSVAPIVVPWASSNEDVSKSLEYLAFVRWQQLVANVKHREIVKYLSKGFISPRADCHLNESDDWLSACSSAGNIKHHLDRLELCGVILNGDLTAAETSNPEAYGPKRGYTSNPLPSFLSEIGTLTSSMGPDDGVLKHEIAATSSPPKTIDDLIGIAKSDLDAFSLLIQRLAAFAAKNETVSSDDTFEATHFSVGLKAYQAIEKKAKRKYGGDFLQVKDLLRGQIVFPDEGTLVCALVCLSRLSSSQNEVPDVADEIKVDLARVKNSFITESPDTGRVLPTGYGHILLNVRLKSGLLAGTFHFSFFIDATPYVTNYYFLL
jgi:hypothetical protein